MATYNKTLGRFELIGIPTAPRGIPQIEVTFDIDANGIVSVSAKDLGTGKEQSIKITASSGLSEEEIERLVKDGELHADEDRKKRELVDARNAADSIIYSTEKSLKEAGEKLDTGTKGEIENAISKLKEAMGGEDTSEIKRLLEELTQVSHKIAEVLYAQAAQSQTQAGPETGPGEPESAKKDEDVVDADFEEVKNDSK
jgi:molecular chaperone DnaK